jgi:class 3 adenylate cyclase
MNYKPAPLDTTALQLTPEILELTERLARNAHDVWARQRLSEGWRHGPARNDERQEHPSLIDYHDLPDSEKEYDRKTALETIKMLLALGYTIESPESKRIGGAGATSISEYAPDAAGRLAEIASAPLADLFRVWSRREDAVWPPGIFAVFAERMLHGGNALAAYDVAREGMKHFPRHIRLRQLLGLALARAHAPAAANEVLLSLYHDGHRDEETIGLLARTFKDLAGETRSDSEARQHLKQAFDLYAAAYREFRSSWTGINAATTALLLEEKGQAADLARHVRDLCLGKLTSASSGELYWLRAAIGEAWLVLMEFSQAEEWYRHAAEAAPKRYGDIQSTRRNARLILGSLGADAGFVEDCLPIPAVAVFSGHMIDRPDRREARFPPQLELSVRDAIRALLARHNIGFGYSSAACGSDILFLEAMFDRDAESYAVLPYEKSSFIADSVDIVPGANWRERCERVLSQAGQITVCSDRPQFDTQVAYEYANLILRGSGLIQARQLDTKLIPLVVWDGKAGDGPGGTASMVREWTERGYRVEHIQIAELSHPEIIVDCRPPRAPAERPRAPATGEFVPCIQALLFADAHGFSKLTESQVPLFVTHFLGMVADLTNHSSHAPIAKNTCGDGLYFVFANVRDAGLFALELCDRIEQIDWAQRGLGELKLRVGLHAGPVYSCLDPVTNRTNYVGAHVSRAARIEPVTPVGKVYASEPFAALVADDGVREFSCEYVGQVAMAKGFGTFPTFAVQRRVARDPRDQ